MAWKVCAGVCAASLALFALFASGCNTAQLEPPPPPPFKATILVEGDPGFPVAGATVTRDKKLLATTAATGRAEIVLDGPDGQTVDAEIRCPEGLTSPAKPISMRIARNTGSSAAPEFRVACPPKTRHVVVAVKADNGPNLPVTYLDKVIAVTDASGAAHFAVDAAPGTQFQVGLDTGENPRLKPASPTKPFTIGQSDEIFVFEQKFQVEKKKVIVHKDPHPHCLSCTDKS